jgi:hypothetical protein
MRTILFSTLAVSILAASGFAQSEVNQRKENQQDRIANGVRSGQLTAKETQNLEKKESNINKEVRTDRKANGGNLTNNEKAKVNGQQNKVSGQIYDDKHNAKKATYGNNEVGQRRENQQDRIANGIQSGKLSAGQASNLEKKEVGINKQDSSDRKANGGNLTDNQKQSLNKQLNKTSGGIAKDKQ